MDENDPDEKAAVQANLLATARHLVRICEREGFVLTVEQRPLQPLAMGHHETVTSIRPARGAP